MSNGVLPLVIKKQRAPVGFDDLAKTAGSKLSGDARLWPSEITAQIATEHPYVPTEQITINFSRIDPVKGAAVGVAKVGNVQDVQIPIIIKRKDGAGDPELAPVDVVQINGRYQPLNESTIMSAIAEKVRGTSLPPQKGREASPSNPYIGDVTGDSTPLEYSGQGTPYAGPIKTASMLDRLASQGIVDDGGRLRGILLENPEILPAAEESDPNNIHVLNKAAGLRSFAQMSPYHFGATAGGLAGGIQGAFGGALAGRGAKNRVVGALKGGAKGALKGAIGGLIATGIKEQLSKRAAHGNAPERFRSLNASSPALHQGSVTSSMGHQSLALSHKGPGQLVPGVRVTNPSVMVVYVDDMGDIYVKFTGGPSERITNADDLKSMLGSNFRECLRSLETNRIFVMANDVQPVSWSVARQDSSKSTPITGSGLYAVQDRTGNTQIGFVVDNVVAPDGTNLKAKLFVAADGGYALSSEMFGFQIMGKSKMHIPASSPRPRALGSFLSYAQGKPLAIAPMYLRSKFKVQVNNGPAHSREKTVYVVEDIMTGMKSSLIPTGAVLSPMRATDVDRSISSIVEGPVYMIPADSEWVQLTNKLPISSSADEVVKTAAENNLTEVAYGGGTFSVRSGDGQWSNLDAPSLACLLADMGVTSPADLREIEKQARSSRGEWLGLNGLQKPTMQKMAVEVVPPNVYPLLERLTESMKPDAELIKAAAEAGSPTLDAVLSLNFITPQSIETFTESIDQFDDASSKLAELLIATRLGLNYMRESPIKTAMESVSKTVEQLRVLRSASDHSRKNE